MGKMDYRYTEVGLDTYASEASTLGFAMGSMPESVVLGALGSLTLVRTDALGAGVYRQQDGVATLVVAAF